MCQWCLVTMLQDLQWLQTQIGIVLLMVDCPKVVCRVYFVVCWL